MKVKELIAMLKKEKQDREIRLWSDEEGNLQYPEIKITDVVDEDENTSYLALFGESGNVII